MTEKVTIIITTYKRPKKIMECLKSIERHTKKDLYDIFIMVDNNNFEISYLINSHYIKRTKEEKYDQVPHVICHTMEEKLDWVGLTNLAIKWFCDTELFLFICDDWLAVEDGWLEKGTKAFKEQFPDNNGLLIFNDYLQEAYPDKIKAIKLRDGTLIRMATHGLTSKTFVKTLGGELLFSGYKHYSADCELAIKAHTLGKYYYLKDVILKHNHWIHTGQKDDVYCNSEKDNFQSDLNLFLIRNSDFIQSF